MLKCMRLICAIAAAATVVSSSSAQQARPPMDPAMMAQLRAIGERARAMPDTPGSGPFPAIKEEVASLPQHVVYRPANVAALGARKLPILAWGNGGCEGDGAGQRIHLEEIASHGYLAIANGTIRSGPGAPPQPPMPAMTVPQPGQPMRFPPPQTTADQLTQAIDWAIKENARPGSPLRGRIDTTAIAVSGWSCGGVQALRIATSDPRVKAVVIHNSGLFSSASPMPGMDLPKAALDRLRTPILYVLGGPGDIAYANGMDDYARITKSPAVAVNIGDAGHGGTFYEPNGGKAATIATTWLDWQLRGDAEAGRAFLGKDCRLCGDPALKIAKKGLD